jgi:HAE1 family hydrophobic/amphiphilic exporter-1
MSKTDNNLKNRWAHVAWAGALMVLASQMMTAQSVAPSSQRIGVAADKQIRLTLRDAVTKALENNREIEIERINTQINGFDLQAARGAYDPTLATSVYYQRQTLPVASILAGGENGRLQTTEFTGTTMLTQRLPWQGGRVNVSFDQSRSSNQNLFNALNPQFNSRLAVELTQPLFRNRRIDAERRQLRIASRRLDLSDSLFRQRAIEIIAGVERAYWDLVFARRDAEIKQESVELARTQLEHNERLVKQGALAPADVVSARVEIERRTDEAEAAVEAIQRAENALKGLILPVGGNEEWNAALIPAEQPALRNDAPLPIDDAMRLAFHNRPEMEQYRLRGELNKIDVEYYRDRAKPQIDLITSYGTYGLSGTGRSSANPITESNQALIDRINQLSGFAGLPLLQPVSFGATPDKFIGGYGQNLGNLFRNEFRAFRAGISINLPLRNRTAKAEYGRALAETRRLDAERQRIEQTIGIEVRNALQAVETARRRVEAARNSRENAELQHRSEQRKFDAGQSTNYFVLDRQNALSAARGRELKALTDHTKAVAELQRAMSMTLVSNNIALADNR